MGPNLQLGGHFTAHQSAPDAHTRSNWLIETILLISLLVLEMMRVESAVSRELSIEWIPRCINPTLR